MKIWQVVVLGVLGLALAGCRTDPSVALLERDNRLKENEIYRLRDRVAELEDAVQATPPADGSPAPRSSRPHEMPAEPGSANGDTRSRSSAPARTKPVEPPETFRSPQIELPSDALPSNSVPHTPGSPPNSEPPRFVPPGSGGSSQWSTPGSRPRIAGQTSNDNDRVAQITLHPSLTGGINRGGRGGDEGLLVVVEPRDFGGNIVESAGDVSVALLDPALSGEQARLGRWDFTAAQTAGMVRTGAEQGIHLQLPWSANSPAHDRLKVFVRYTTRDGRKLQAERLIGVALGEANSGERYVPAPTEPPRTASRPQRPEWSPMR